MAARDRRLRRTITLAAAAVAALLCVAPSPAAARDADRDRFPDGWETGQVRPGGLNLKALGARPKRKDIFVELEFANAGLRAQLPCSELDKLYDAFRTAPVSNPNGSKAADINGDGQLTVLPAWPNEWLRLSYRSGGQIGPVPRS